jgi:hypothetical protein
MATKDVWLGTTVSKTSTYINTAATKCYLGAFMVSPYVARTHPDVTLRNASTGSRIVRWTGSHNASVGGSSGQVYTEETAPYFSSGIYASIRSGTRVSVIFKEV